MSGQMQVEIAYALPERQYVVSVSLPAGATVADALRAVAGRTPFDTLDLDSLPVGIFGDRVERSHSLEDRDRVEVYRPLVVDPREARRRRAAGESAARDDTDGGAGPAG